MEAEPALAATSAAAERERRRVDVAGRSQGYLVESLKAEAAKWRGVAEELRGRLRAADEERCAALAQAERLHAAELQAERKKVVALQRQRDALRAEVEETWDMHAQQADSLRRSALEREAFQLDLAALYDRHVRQLQLCFEAAAAPVLGGQRGQPIEGAAVQECISQLELGLHAVKMQRLERRRAHQQALHRRREAWSSRRAHAQEEEVFRQRRAEWLQVQLANIREAYAMENGSFEQLFLEQEEAADAKFEALLANETGAAMGRALGGFVAATAGESPFPPQASAPSALSPTEAVAVPREVTQMAAGAPGDASAGFRHEPEQKFVESAGQQKAASAAPQVEARWQSAAVPLRASWLAEPADVPAISRRDGASHQEFRRPDQEMATVAVLDSTMEADLVTPALLTASEAGVPGADLEAGRASSQGSHSSRAPPRLWRPAPGSSAAEAHNIWNREDESDEEGRETSHADAAGPEDDAEAWDREVELVRAEARIQRRSLSEDLRQRQSLATGSPPAAPSPSHSEPVAANAAAQHGAPPPSLWEPLAALERELAGSAPSVASEPASRAPSVAGELAPGAPRQPQQPGPVLRSNSLADMISAEAEAPSHTQSKLDSDMDLLMGTPGEPPILAPRPTAKYARFIVDNTLLQARTHGLQYRCSKWLEDKDLKNLATWGSTVHGIDSGDGWLEVYNRYLPVEVQGVRVLVPCAPKDISQRAPDSLDLQSPAATAGDLAPRRPPPTPATPAESAAAGGLGWGALAIAGAR